MRILSAKIYSENNIIKLQFEIIKTPVERTYNFYKQNGKQARIAMLDGFNRQLTRQFVNIYQSSSVELANQFIITSLIIDLPPMPLDALNLFFILEDYLKTAKCDYILVDSESITNYIKPLVETTDYKKPAQDYSLAINDYLQKKERRPLNVFECTIAMNDYLENKNKLTTSFNAYLIQKIITINPTFKFLEVMYLLNPAVDFPERHEILRNLVQFWEADKNTFSQFMKNFKRFALAEFIYPCIGKKAHDGGNYYYDYTELNVFDFAKFIYKLGDKKLRVYLADNPAYKKLYLHRPQLFIEEASFLGKILGFNLSTKTTLDILVFDHQSSELLMKKGLIYDENFLCNYAMNNYLDNNSVHRPAFTFKQYTKSPFIIFNQKGTPGLLTEESDLTLANCLNK